MLMPAFYGRRLNVCLRWRLSAQIFVRPRKTTTSAGVLPPHFLAGSASLQPVKRRGAKRPQERSGSARVFPYRRFLPRDVELEPRRNFHGRGWRGSFIPKNGRALLGARGVALQARPTALATGASAPPGRQPPLSRGFVIDGGLRDLGQGFVGLLLFAERLVE